MADFPGLVGGAGQVRSIHVNAERTFNWYVEQAPGLPRAKTWLAPTPALEPFVALGEGPVRAIFAQAGRAFAVGGTGFYEIFATGTATFRGAMAADGRPATISSNNANGNQLFVTSGGHGYIYSLTANTLVEITDLGFPAPVVMGTFSDGYFIALKRASNQFNISSLFDGLVWDALDVFQVSTSADPVVALVESHRDLWLFGEQTTSVWSNTGDVDIPYQPVPNVKINQGAAAPFAAVTIDNTIMWLGQSANGDRVVWRANGYTPQRVSTHAVEYALRQARRVDDAIAYAYEDEGHTFYVLYVPDLANVRTWGTTWVYDVAVDTWHERCVWDTIRMDWQPHLSRCHAFGFGRHMVGDRLSPAIYHMRLGPGADSQLELVGAPVVVQVVSEGFLDTDPTREVTFTDDVTAGNPIVVAVVIYGWDNDPGEVSDSQGNAYAVQIARGFVSATAFGVAWFRATASATGALTVAHVLPGQYVSMAALEIGGGGDTNQVGSRITDPAALTSTAGMPATTENGCLVLGIFTRDGSGGTVAPGTGWTSEAEVDLVVATYNALSVISRVGSAAGLTDPTWTHTSMTTYTAGIAIAPVGDE